VGEMSLSFEELKILRALRSGPSTPSLLAFTLKLDNYLVREKLERLLIKGHVERIKFGIYTLTQEGNRILSKYEEVLVAEK